MLFEVSAAMAFVQGLLSFLSPCVLPLVPAYLSYLSGTSIEGMEQRRGLVIRNAGFYILGFSVVFVAMGATATAVGAFLQENADIIRIICGVVLVLFGLSMLLPIRFLQKEKRLRLEVGGAGIVQSLLMGMVFALGWTPCIGPVLASVLMMAAGTASMWQGIGLLLLYSLGMAAPFMLIAIFLQALKKPLMAIKRYMPVIRAVSAVLLIAMGILMLTNSFMLLAAL